MTEKKQSAQEALRKRVYEFYNDNFNKGISFTVKHFTDENIPLSTVYSINSRLENDSGHERAQGSGRKARIMTKRCIKALKKKVDHHAGISQRSIAEQMGCSQKHVSTTLKTKTGIHYFKQKVIPKRTEKQISNAKTQCGRLYHQFSQKACVIDDESYFTLSHSTLSGNRGFYSSDKSATPPSQKYQTKTKFEQKLLVWLAISPRGISKVFIVPSGMAINQKIYKEECIQKRLIPFIQEHHSDGQYLFWPDKASSHYAKSVTSYFEEKKLKYVLKEDNPTNVPECRPIEDFWGILKGLVYKKNWKASNLIELRRKILLCIREVDITLVQRLAESVNHRLDLVRRNGVIEDN